jgi:P27 family predicted phage terminase small subunit
VRPPSGLTAAARAAWQEAVATLAEIGEAPELSRGALDRYARAVGVWRQLERDWVKLGRPALALGGATGKVEVPHPLLGQIALARREAATLGGLLGLDPQGRRKLSRRVGAGRPPGAASAPDRAAPPRRVLRSVQ